MRLPRHWKAALLCLIAAFRLGLVPGQGPACAGQSDTGGMVGGRVVGPDGRGVPGALVRLEDGSGDRSDVVSDGEGSFQFGAVTPGEYTLRVRTRDLSDYEADHLTVGLGTARHLNPRLAARWVHRAVLVDARIAALEAGAGADAVNALAGEVPNNSGQWSSEAAVLSASGEDGGLSSRGLSPLMGSITVDGMNGKLAFRGRQRATEGNGFATVQSAVSAFQGSGDGLAGTAGRAAGGAAGTATRSGGNRMHGQAVLFDRGSVGQAANAFSKTMTEEPAGTVTANGQPVLYRNGQPIVYTEVPYHAPDRRQRWEVAAGGPIRRDRMW